MTIAELSEHLDLEQVARRALSMGHGHWRKHDPEKLMGILEDAIKQFLADMDERESLLREHARDKAAGYDV